MGPSRPWNYTGICSVCRDRGVNDDTLVLTPEERAALIGLLRRTLDEARYPFSHRYDPLKAILAKLDPPEPKPEPRPPLPAGGGPRVGQGRRRR
jgi:hypothetical protein